MSGRRRRAPRVSVEPEEPGDWVPLLHEEVGRLPEKFRTPLMLCYLEGLTQEEVARRLGWPIGTVRSRVARGRERLRQPAGPPRRGPDGRRDGRGLGVGGRGGHGARGPGATDVAGRDGSGGDGRGGLHHGRHPDRGGHPDHVLDQAQDQRRRDDGRPARGRRGRRRRAIGGPPGPGPARGHQGERHPGRADASRGGRPGRPRPPWRPPGRDSRPCAVVVEPPAVKERPPWPRGGPRPSIARPGPGSWPPSTTPTGARRSRSARS